MSVPNRQPHSPSPIYGIRGGFDIGDLPAGSSTADVPVITTIGVPTTSAAINIGARSVELSATFSDSLTSCDILVHSIPPSGSVLVYTFTGINNTNADSLFVGGYEGVLLDGYPFTITVQNFAGGGTVAINAKRTS